MNRYIHIWDLPIERVYVQFKEGFREDFFNKAYNKFNSWNDLGKFLGVKRADTTIARNWKNGMNCYPLTIIFKIGNLINISREEIEKNIIQIRCKTRLDKRGGSSGKPINNPKLPIKIDKNFVEMLGHICGDGSIPTKYSKKGIKLLYVNSEPKLVESFQYLIKEIFGDIEAKIYIRKGTEYGKKYLRPNYMMQYPTILSLFVLSVFDYKVGEDMNIPNFINKLSFEEKCAFLRALYDDEGCVKIKNKTIQIDLKPYNPVKGIREVLKDVGINTKRVRKDKNMHCIDIFGSDNIHLFYKIIGFKHPSKKEKLEKIIENGWKFKRFPNGIARKKILDILKVNKNITSGEIALMLDRSPRIIRKHLYSLKNE